MVVSSAAIRRLSSRTTAAGRVRVILRSPSPGPLDDRDRESDKAMRVTREDLTDVCMYQLGANASMARSTIARVTSKDK